MIGIILSEFFPTPRAGRDRNGARAERLAASDVARGVTDDVNFLHGKFPTVFFFGAGPGKRAELVAIVVIVREGSEFKKMPDAVMVEFQLRAARQVPSQQAEHDVFSSFQLLEQ